MSNTGCTLIARTDLSPEASLAGAVPLCTLAHLTDAHVMDASSPARVPFLARFGPPFQSTFRRQEALTARVLDAAVRAIATLSPDLVVQGGDLIDNAQENELRWALQVIRGGSVAPGSGDGSYAGVQSAENPDSFYYRPDVDEPSHPGLLRKAAERFRATGLERVPWLHVLGDHELLLAGELVPSELTRMIATGNRALWTLPDGLSLPEGLPSAGRGGSLEAAALSGLAEQFLLQALQGPLVEVEPDPARRQLAVEEVVAELSPREIDTRCSDRLDYVHDHGPRVRLVVLDLASRTGGSGGRVAAGQVEFLREALACAGERWVVFISHQTLRQTASGDELQALLDGSPRVILVLNGHTHQHRIRPRHTPAGGHWQIETSSLIDWPQQCRAIRLMEISNGREVAIQTWTVDHASGVSSAPAEVSRELARLDAACLDASRLSWFAGEGRDRDAVLYLPPRG